MTKLNTEKLLNDFISHDEFMLEQLKDEEYRKEYLNLSIKEFIEEGDYNLFFKSLERVIRATDSINNFAQKTKIGRTALYEMFNGKRVPRLDTIGKILKELGYTLKVA